MRFRLKTSTNKRLALVESVSYHKKYNKVNQDKPTIIEKEIINIFEVKKMKSKN